MRGGQLYPFSPVGSFLVSRVWTTQQLAKHFWKKAAKRVFKLLPPTQKLTDVIFLSNGVCISTCSLFQTTLMDLRPMTSNLNIKFVSYGGVPGLPLALSADPANVLDFIAFASLPYRERLQKGTLYPQQYLREEADVRLPIWTDGTLASTLPVWAATAALLGA